MSKNKNTLRLLVIAVVFGLAAAGLAMLYLNQREAELVEALTPKSELVPVVVASRDLVKGDVLDGSTLSIREIPSEYVNPDAVRPDQFADIEGEVLVQNLAAGRPLLRSFIGREFPLDFSDTIPEKRRAMTIQVDEINSISGLIRPGNRIDLFVNLPPGAGGADDKSQSNEVVPVLENVEVLATGQDAARDYEEKVRILRGGIPIQPDQNYTTLTINVTAKQAALLAIAQDKGDMMALLRNRKDNSGSGFTKVSTETVKSHAQTLARQAAARNAAKTMKGKLVVGEDGVIRTRDGKVLANQNLVIAEDGTIMTKNGVVLSGRGLSINEKGELVTADGRVVDPDSIIVTADGTVMTKDGDILGGPASRPAGSVKLTADGRLEADNGVVLSGVKLNADGKVVMADGSLVDPSDLVVRDDGTVLTKDGRIVQGAKAGIAPGKLSINEDGAVVSADGTVIRGATLTKDGKLKLADGSIVDPADVVINVDGSVTRRDGTVLAGVHAENVRLPGAGTSSGPALEIDYIVGGVSEDSVATVKKLPIAE